MDSARRKNRKFELENCVIETQNLLLQEKEKDSYKTILEMVERPLIEMTLQKTDGNQKKAAKLLGLNRNTLHSRIKKLRINVSKYKFVY